MGTIFLVVRVTIKASNVNAALFGILANVIRFLIFYLGHQQHDMFSLPYTCHLHRDDFTYNCRGVVSKIGR
jgi:hypothetical protein